QRHALPRSPTRPSPDLDWYMVGPHDPSADPTRGWQTPLNPAQIYRQGIPAFNAWCEQKYGAAFSALTAEQQDAALTSLQKGEVRSEEHTSELQSRAHLV